MAGTIAFDTTKWLASHGLGTYAQAFRDNHIEVETMSSLTMDDLREMGITSVGHKRKILAAIASLEQGYWRRSKLVSILPGVATMRARSCLEHCVARRGLT